MSEKGIPYEYPKNLGEQIKEDYPKLFEQKEIKGQQVLIEQLPKNMAPFDDSLFCIVENSVFEFIAQDEDTDKKALEKMKSPENLEALIELGSNIEKDWDGDQNKLFQKGKGEISNYAVRYIPSDDSDRFKNLFNKLDRRSGSSPKRFRETNLPF